MRISGFEGLPHQQRKSIVDLIGGLPDVPRQQSEGGMRNRPFPRLKGDEMRDAELSLNQAGWAFTDKGWVSPHTRVCARCKWSYQGWGGCIACGCMESKAWGKNQPGYDDGSKR